LSQEALTDYARQYYHHVAAFPTYLSAVHARCEDQATRKQILSNLIDEEAGSPNHPNLWKRFVESLGVDDVDLANTRKQPETQNLIDTFRSVCGEGSTAQGLAALYAYESQIPAICESKIDGLKKHYGFKNPEHYEYFSVHLEADREHSAAERKMLNDVRQQPQFRFCESLSGSRSGRALGNALWRLPASRDCVLMVLELVGTSRHGRIYLELLVVSVRTVSRLRVPTN
jgi:pyrroloquinoline-quinone synthase